MGTLYGVKNWPNIKLTWPSLNPQAHHTNGWTLQINDSFQALISPTMTVTRKILYCICKRTEMAV